MKQLKIVLSIFLILVFLSCKDDKKIENKSNEVSDEVNVSTFYFIQHAEKDRTDPNNTDPELSQKGLGRAMHWADILNNTELDAIYSTNHIRTSMTAAPISIKKNIDVKYYDPHNIDIEQFKTDNLNKTVLIVGHSKTTLDFVNKMIKEEKYTSLNDNNNGNLFIVQIINETTTVQQLYFNCSCLE